MTRISLSVRMLAALAAALVLSGPAPRAQDRQARPLDDPEAYAVYASVLRSSAWTTRLAQAKSLVFQQETGTRWECVPVGKPLDTDWKPVVDNYREANAGLRLLQTGFSIGFPYVVVPAAELDARVHDGSNPKWSGFYALYPDSAGVMIVSAVGFDPPRQRAMVYVGNACGPLCGRGAYHLLEKVDGAWRVARVPGVSYCYWSS